MEQTVMRAVPLSKDLSIYISDEHSFGTDAVLLASFAGSGKKGLRALDIGTGCGIIPMLLIRDRAVSEVYGIDISEKAVTAAKRTAKENGVEDIFTVGCADLRERPSAKTGYYDLVTCNPPYFAQGSGAENENSADTAARHETECTLADVCSAAARSLRYGGRFCLCHKPERLADIMTEMRKARLEPKRLRFVIQRVGDAPWLVLVEGKLGGKPSLDVMPSLCIEGNGKLSAEMLAIYGDYKEGHGDGI